MRYKRAENALFKLNRQNFVAKMKPNSVAIFISNPEISISADALYPFKQNPDFFYLTGIDQEQCALILYPDATKENEKAVLFLRETNELISIWDGHKVTKKEGKEFSGISNLKWMSDFENMLPYFVNQAENIYLNTNEHGRMHSDFPYGDLLFAKKVKENFPLHNFERSAPILADLRSVKSEAEIDYIQEACNITGKAFERVCQFIKPGVNEYEVEAEIIHEFIRNGANGHAYQPIIGSGANACVLHYIDNNQICKDGDMVLMDFGANYGNYCADLTRTIPVNGKFTDRQKAVYNAVLRVMKASTELLVPGKLIDDCLKESQQLMQKELLDLKLITKEDIANATKEKPAYKKYFMHGVSHHLGLDVHDVGKRNAKLQAGMVFTVEPGIYIREENLGIRIENDVVVQASGAPKDLMAHIPREVEEIEDLMNS